MKKTYMNPEMVIVKIQTAQMLAASPGNQTLDKGAPSVSSSDEIGSRGFFDWDDED